MAGMERAVKKGLENSIVSIHSAPSEQVHKTNLYALQAHSFHKNRRKKWPANQNKTFKTLS